MTDSEAPPAGLIRAAGAVVWRGDGPDLEVVVVHRPKYDDWSFPKGKLKPGEHVIAGALREVAEETGLSVTLGRRLPAAHYPKGGRPKRVDYWAARVLEEPAHEPSDEVDRIEWLPIAAARARLTYGWDAVLLRALLAGPRETTPFVLVRHAHAGSRLEWDGDDDLRPLDELGEAQARTIAEILHAYRPTSLVSSPSRRCVETLLPYAAREALTIRTERLLAETAFDPARSPALALALLDQGESAVICGHGKVLPELISMICEHRLEGRVQDTALDKGAMAVLHHSGGRITAVERYTT